MNTSSSSSSPENRDNDIRPRVRNVGIEQRLLRAWKALAASPGTPLLVGFSGGPDSLALATALQRIGPLAGFDLHALHVDHALRPASGEEAATAAELARTLGIPCRVVRLQHDPVAVHPGVGVEEAARRERYRELTAEATRLGAEICALAHHLDDQAETIVLHMLRGAGLTGATGMLPRSTVTVPWWDDVRIPERSVTIWRPWLNEDRGEIAAYLRSVAPRLLPIIDPSNHDLALMRNRVRHTLVPMLEELRPGATRALARFGLLAGQDDGVLDAIAREHLERLGASIDDLPKRQLEQLPLPILRRMLKIVIAELGGPTDVSAERADALVAAIRRPRGRVTIELGEGCTALIYEGRIRISPGG